MKPSENQFGQPTIVMYAVVREDGKYFAGFNTQLQAPEFVDTIYGAKLCTNKYDVRLHETDRLVEVRITLDEENMSISSPFRPRRRTTNVTYARVQPTVAVDNDVMAD